MQGFSNCFGLFQVIMANQRKQHHNNMGVSKNRGTPKSSILIGFSIINHPFWDIPIFGNPHLMKTCDSLTWDSLTSRSLPLCELEGGGARWNRWNGKVCRGKPARARNDISWVFLPGERMGKCPVSPVEERLPVWILWFLCGEKICIRSFLLWVVGVFGTSLFGYWIWFPTFTTRRKIPRAIKPRPWMALPSAWLWVL